MMKGKNILILILCFLFVIALWGCQPKATPDAEGNGKDVDTTAPVVAPGDGTEAGTPNASGPDEKPENMEGFVEGQVKSPGEQFFADVCVKCHSVPGTEYDEERSIPLVGLSEKYDEDGLKEQLATHESEIPPEILQELIEFLFTL